ncbi:MAG: GHKL domain-containing protein, partial [Candidatus Omnitrophica bacterium]|nr:GHKL domain-containing protein [Candidatus Omnitrophota bacterium]
EHGLEIIELIAEKDDVAARRKIEELVYQESEEIQEMLYEFQDEEVANLSMGVGQIDTMARNLRKACLTLLIATLLIVIIFIVKSTKMISSSMKLLIKGTHEISKGHFGYKALINSKDEFGEMLGEFNAMSAKLQEIAASKYLLEKEIKERMVMEHKLTEYTHEVEAVNKELESFTYIISHDLKEPLRSIDAFSKFIMDDYLDKLDEQGIYYLNRVRANAKKMQELIEDLLEVSRLEQKRNPFSDSAVNDIIDEVKLRLECSIKEKNVEIVIKDALPIIFCDKVRLTEVFANIMSNAIKFMDKKDPLVEIGYSEAKTHHRFYIKDNGIGIEEKYYDKIFDIFQRLNVKEKYEGTGAGLAIVKKIIQMHHGKVWVDSTFGEGSTFHFSILKDKDAILERRKLGEILIDKELVSSEDVQKALVEQRRGSVLEGGEEIS